MSRHESVLASTIPHLLLASGICAACLCTTVTALAQQPEGIRGSVWVANEGASSISVIDAATDQVVTTLTGIRSPHNVQLSPNNEIIWAVSGPGSLAVAIDAETYKVKGTAPTGKMPAHIVLTPDGRRAYVTNGGDNSVTAIDVAAMKDIATIPTGKGPHGLRPSPDGKWIYVANLKDSSVSVLETASNTKVADITVGQGPAQVAFSPDGKFVYVSLNRENMVAKVNVDKRTLIAKTPVGTGPIQVFVSPNDKYLLVANQGTDKTPSTTVSVIDTRTFSAVAAVETGKGAHGIVIDPSSRFAYITNIFGNNVAVLNLENLKVMTVLAVGMEPNGISFSPMAPSPAPAVSIALDLPDVMKMDESGMKD